MTPVLLSMAPAGMLPWSMHTVPILASPETVVTFLYILRNPLEWEERSANLEYFAMMLKNGLSNSTGVRLSGTERKEEEYGSEK